MTNTTEHANGDIEKLSERIVNLLCVLDMKHTFVSDDFDEMLVAIKALDDKAREYRAQADFPEVIGD